MSCRIGSDAVSPSYRNRAVLINDHGIRGACYGEKAGSEGALGTIAVAELSANHIA